MLWPLPLAFAATALLSPAVHAIQSVSRAGKYLYTADGKRFYIKGIAYQPDGSGGQTNTFDEPLTFTDPLADASACSRDLPNLQTLGVNTVRVYNVDSTLNHDSCMGALSNAGIYTIIDLGLPVNGSIDRDSPSWTTNLLSQYTNTIDSFAKYDNVLAYNVGNEVVLNNETFIAPFVKAAARDVKAYLASKSSSILVGYASIDGADDFKTALADYLTCDPSSSNSGATALDIYGLNNYEWCGDSTFADSGYSSTESDFSSFNVVAYFSEFGCVPSDGSTRQWEEVGALFSSDMTDVWSGGVAFSYFPKDDPHGHPAGLATVSSDNTSVTLSPDFGTLEAAFANATGVNSPSQSSAGSTTYPACQTSSALVASTTLPPTPNEAACACVEADLSCRFTPAISNYDIIVGTLLDTACSLLGQKGLDCDDISSNGTTGVYGRVSDCDPTIMLSYVMSEYYEANSRDEQACSFAGNGTVNSATSPSQTAAAVASSCIANPSATFVPSAASTGGGSSSTGKSSSSGVKNGAISAMLPSQALISALSVVLALAVGGAAFILV